MVAIFSMSFFENLAAILSRRSANIFAGEVWQRNAAMECCWAHLIF
jgi:hypothetical protein